MEWYLFFPGDLFDEGKWCPQKEFDDYIERFNVLFKVPDGTTMYAVVGNHDIGYHYRYVCFINFLAFDIIIVIHTCNSISYFFPEKIPII